jgi:hypothetical protein
MVLHSKDSEPPNNTFLLEVCRRDFTDPGDYVCGGPEGQQLCSIIKTLETQTHELKYAMAGLKDISDTTGHPRSESLSYATLTYFCSVPLFNRGSTLLLCLADKQKVEALSKGD